MTNSTILQIGDHIFGLVPLLASILNGAGGTLDPDGDSEPMTISKESQHDVRKHA